MKKRDENNERERDRDRERKGEYKQEVNKG